MFMFGNNSSSISVEKKMIQATTCYGGLKDVRAKSNQLKIYRNEWMRSIKI